MPKSTLVLRMLQGTKPHTLPGGVSKRIRKDFHDRKEKKFPREKKISGKLAKIVKQSGKPRLNQQQETAHRLLLKQYPQFNEIILRQWNKSGTYSQGKGHSPVKVVLIPNERWLTEFRRKNPQVRSLLDEQRVELLGIRPAELALVDNVFSMLHEYGHAIDAMRYPDRFSEIREEHTNFNREIGPWANNKTRVIRYWLLPTEKTANEFVFNFLKSHWEKIFPEIPRPKKMK